MHVTVSELKREMADGAVVVDVREPQEYDAGHVPGALLMPLAMVPLVFWLAKPWLTSMSFVASEVTSTVYVPAMARGPSSSFSQGESSVGSAPSTGPRPG